MTKKSANVPNAISKAKQHLQELDQQKLQLQGLVPIYEESTRLTAEVAIVDESMSNLQSEKEALLTTIEQVN